jgi:DNA-binding phage protein
MPHAQKGYPMSYITLRLGIIGIASGLAFISGSAPLSISHLISHLPQSAQPGLASTLAAISAQLLIQMT